MHVCNQSLVMPACRRLRVAPHRRCLHTLDTPNPVSSIDVKTHQHIKYFEFCYKMKFQGLAFHPIRKNSIPK